MSKKVKIWVLVSALWVFGWLVLFIAKFPGHTYPSGALLDARLELTAAFMVFSLGPLLLGWGIWWVMKSDKPE